MNFEFNPQVSGYGFRKTMNEDIMPNWFVQDSCSIKSLGGQGGGDIHSTIDLNPTSPSFGDVHSTMRLPGFDAMHF